MLNFIINHSPLFYFVQSFWRDEAFSVLIAERPLSTFLTKLTFEPPVYYTILHFWIKVFGNSEIAVRSLSLLAFATACVIVIEWADKLFRKSWLAVYLPLLFFFNPMLLYYAFEVRTYGLYILFATLSLFSYQQERWKLYIFATLLGFYTHTYFIFLFAAQIFHYMLIHGKTLLERRHIQLVLTDNGIKAILLAGLGIAPWMVKVIIEASKLKSSWYFPVDLQLVRSVLGNMYVGYEGTPWFLWRYTAMLSAVLLVFCIMAVISKKTRKRNSLFVSAIFIPLGIVIGVSFFKPLFVNRYCIPATIGLVFTTVFAIESIKNVSLQRSIAFVILISTIWFNTWYPTQHPKTPIRDTISQINTLRTKNDVVYATSSLVLFETLYYSHPRNDVYLYNPTQSPFPWYVGDAAFSDNLLATEIPMYPKRAFMVNPNGSFTIQFRLPNPTVQRDDKIPN